jgi:hypothetical protein
MPLALRAIRLLVRIAVFARQLSRPVKHRQGRLRSLSKVLKRGMEGGNGGQGFVAQLVGQAEGLGEDGDGAQAAARARCTAR